MVDLIRQFLTFLVNNYALYLIIVMGVIVSLTIGLLSLIKKPIKKLTSKIENAKLRKLANKMFIIFAFIISTLIWVSLYLCAPIYFPLDSVEILLSGAFSIVIYAFGDGIITKSAAQQLVETISEIAEDQNKDEKKTEKEKAKSAVKEYLKKVEK